MQDYPDYYRWVHGNAFRFTYWLLTVITVSDLFMLLYRVLKATDGTSVALSNFEGKSPVVVFFYPKVRGRRSTTLQLEKHHRRDMPSKHLDQD